MTINRRTVASAILVLTIGILALVFLNNGNDTKAEPPPAEPLDLGFAEDPIQFEKFLFELTGSEYSNDRYIFHYQITNTSNVEINANKTSFKIMNNEKLYSQNTDDLVMNELNPGMSTTGTVDFIMKKEDLEDGSPIMAVYYGYFNNEGYEFFLTKGKSPARN